MCVTYFNSIKVRLELVAQFHVLLADSDFNSIKVRLELPIVIAAMMHIIDFNSIKVRLELVMNAAYFKKLGISIP